MCNDIHMFQKIMHPQILQAIHTSIRQFSVYSESSLIGQQIDFSNMLERYMTRGKMIRSTLYLYWVHAYRDEQTPMNEEILAPFMPIAVVLEWLQVYLLIHDDIMDNDDTRRGMPSMHIQIAHNLSSLLGKQSYNKDDYTLVHRDTQTPYEDLSTFYMGTALAMCLGDSIHSFIFLLLSDLEQYYEQNPAYRNNHTTLMRICAQRLVWVGMGQFDDLYFSSYSGNAHMLDNIDTIISQDTIIRMYERKTGEYTFTLPALLALYSVKDRGADMGSDTIPHSSMSTIETMGNLMGCMFQIQDDVIDLQYSSRDSGKPQGSDFIERKYNYLFSVLFEYAKKKGKTEELWALWNEANKSDEHLQLILKYCNEWNVWEHITLVQENYLEQAKTAITTLNIESEYKEGFNNFLEYLIMRER